MQNIDAALDAQDSALTSIQLAIHRQQKRLQMEEHLLKLMLQTVENESSDVEQEDEPHHPTVDQFNETQEEDEEEEVEEGDDGNVATTKSKATAAKKTAANNTSKSSKRKR